MQNYKSGFHHEADKFFNASDFLNSAKTLINNCKKIIDDYQIEIGDYYTCKNNIESCEPGHAEKTSDGFWKVTKKANVKFV